MVELEWFPRLTIARAAHRSGACGAARAWRDVTDSTKKNRLPLSHNTQLTSFVGVKRRWSFINNVRGLNKTTYSQIHTMKNSFGHILTEAKQMANLFNVCFSNLGIYNGASREYIPNTTQSIHRFRFSYFTLYNVNSVLLGLDASKPLGPSSIPAWALKDSRSIIATHLCFIFNEFIKIEKFPNSAKLADVTPIFKT